MATSASWRVWNTVLQISSDFSVLKKVSTMALKLLYLSSYLVGAWQAEVTVDLADDVSLHAPHDLSGSFTLCSPSGSVSFRGCVISQPDDRHAIKGCIGLSVSAAIQPHAVCFAA